MSAARFAIAVVASAALTATLTGCTADGSGKAATGRSSTDTVTVRVPNSAKSEFEHGAQALAAGTQLLGSGVHINVGSRAAGGGSSRYTFTMTGDKGKVDGAMRKFTDAIRSLAKGLGATVEASSK